jgi:uncharacterized membrane protein YdjX (TVP38/TMEM64 family)
MSDDPKPGGWRVWLVAVLVLAMSIAALVLWGRPVYDFILDQERLRGWVGGFGSLGPAVLIALEVAQTLLAPIPGQAIEAAGGFLFGPWLGTLYAMLGIGLGSLLSFSLARRFGRPWVVRVVNPRILARLDDLARQGGALFFFLVWLVPFAPDDLACLAAGLTPMPFRQFLLLMVLGRLPGILVATWIGANAAQIKPVWWVVLIALASVVALALWRWGERLQSRVLCLLQRLARRPER